MGLWKLSPFTEKISGQQQADFLFFWWCPKLRGLCQPVIHFDSQCLKRSSSGIAASIHQCAIWKAIKGRQVLKRDPRVWNYAFSSSKESKLRRDSIVRIVFGWYGAGSYNGLQTINVNVFKTKWLTILVICLFALVPQPETIQKIFCPGQNAELLEHLDTEWLWCGWPGWHLFFVLDPVRSWNLTRFAGWCTSCDLKAMVHKPWLWLSVRSDLFWFFHVVSICCQVPDGEVLEMQRQILFAFQRCSKRIHPLLQHAGYRRTFI